MQPRDQKLTIESFHEWFHYDGKTLKWKDNKRETKICFNKAGYPVIRFMANARLVHRIAFAMHHGYMPNEIDHIDGNPKNYSIENLRECTSSRNKMNIPARKSNKSGYKGVHYDNTFKRWVACVIKDKKTYKCVGFDDAEDANDFVCLLREMLHGEFVNHGINITTQRIQGV